MVEWKVRRKVFNFVDISIWCIIFLGLFSSSQYGISLSWVIVPIICLVFATLILEERLYFKSVHLIFVLWWAEIFLSTALSPVVEIKRDVFSSLIFAGFFILITSLPCDQERAKKFLNMYIFTAVLGSFEIILNWLRGSYYNIWFQRSTIVVDGVFRDPNYVSGYLAPAFLLLLLLANKDHKYFKLKICSMALILTAMLCLGSRGGLLSAIIPAMMYILIQAKKTVNSFIKMILLTIMTVAIGLFVLSQFPEQSLNRLLYGGSGKRFDLWEAGLGPFFNNPIIGQGIGSASKYAIDMQGQVSHNMYVDILSMSGIIGTGTYLWVVYRMGFGRESDKIYMILLYMSFFIPQVFINGFNTLSMYLPLIMIYFCSIYFEPNHAMICLQEE